jgi:hypothetical protein
MSKSKAQKKQSRHRSNPGQVRKASRRQVRAPNATRDYAASESKTHKIVALLLCPNGAALGELVRTTGWKKHSIRAAISSIVIKRLGYQVASIRSGTTRRYRIETPPSDASTTNETP